MSEESNQAETIGKVERVLEQLRAAALHEPSVREALEGAADEIESAESSFPTSEEWAHVAPVLAVRLDAVREELASVASELRFLATTPEFHMGACPECASEGVLANIGRDHWMHCEAHRTKWCVGSNLFSGWRHEDESVWRKNSDMLATFREVEPIHYRHEIKPGSDAA